LLVRPPEITTFRPAVDGSGEEAIVNAPGVHWVAQQAVVQQAVVQQVVVQQVVPVDGQQTVEGAAPEDAGRLGPLTGVGQHCTIIPWSRRCGQIMCGVLPTAPAGLSIAKTHSEAARNSSDQGTIGRRIAENRRRDYPYL
jgi:hypothetical protein